MGSQSKQPPPPLPPWGYAVAGATGAVFANAAVYPLDMSVPLPPPQKIIIIRKDTDLGNSVKTKLQVQVGKRPATTATDDKTPNATTAQEKDEEAGDEAEAEQQEHYESTLDAMRKIVASAGVRGLYAGMPGSLLGVASTNFAYFYWYTFVRSRYLRRAGNPPALGAAAELLLGAVAGALAQLMTIPVAVVTTRQQTRPPAAPPVGLLATAREVVAADGPSGLWRGLKASLVLVVNPAITYGSYQRLRHALFPDRPRLSALEAFLLGALSKAAATLATQPLIVAKVGLQSRPPVQRRGRPFASFVDVMRFIVQHEGWPALFKGIGPQLAKGLVVQGLLMMTKERLELAFALLFAALARLRQRRLARAALLLAKHPAPAA